MALTNLLPLVRQLPSYNTLLASLRAKGRPWVVGPTGSEKALVLAALAEDLGLPQEGPVVVITASHDAADRLHGDLLAFQPTLKPRLVVFPQWDTLPFD